MKPVDQAAPTRPVRLTPELAANVLGVVGLVCMVVAVGGLTGTWWWPLGAAGLVMVGLSYSAHTRVQAQPLQVVRDRRDREVAAS